METRLSAKGLKFISNIIITLSSTLALGFFLLSIDRTAVVIIISLIMLAGALYLMWLHNEFDSISLLVFFFGTTACFFFFSDIITSSLSQAISVAVFAILSLFLSNYLLNTAVPIRSTEKAIYKISLAIIFTEIFWVLSFLKISQLSKGAITAVLFFNFLAITRDILEGKIGATKFAFLIAISIILVAIVIYRI